MEQPGTATAPGTDTALRPPLTLSKTRATVGRVLLAFNKSWEGGRRADVAGVNEDGTVNLLVGLDPKRDDKLIRFEHRGLVFPLVDVPVFDMTAMPYPQDCPQFAIWPQVARPGPADEGSPINALNKALCQLSDQVKALEDKAGAPPFGVGSGGTSPAADPRRMGPRTSPADLEHRFKHHPPQGDQATRYAAVRDAILQAADRCVSLTPVSREQTLALNALDHAMFLFNAAIARNE